MSSADVVKRYFEAIADRDIDAAVALWAPGGVERLVGQRELTAPDGVRANLGELHGAFPDLSWEVLDMTAGEDRVAVRWRARGTFAGPARFQGFAANGARLEMEGCDVLTVNADGQIEHLDAYVDTGERGAPARTAAAGGLARRSASDPARQRAHPRALVDPGI